MIQAATCSVCSVEFTYERRGGAIRAYCDEHKGEKEKHKNRREHINATRRVYRAKVRTTVLATYGGKCACCGEAEPKFLAIDHINGGGRKEREVHLGYSFYMHLYKLPEPRTDLQVLCHNCNMAKGFYGVCPHQEKQ